MAIAGSGQLSLADIANEKGESLSNVSLLGLSTTNINSNSPYQPDQVAPHAISEFYNYDHLASPPGPTLYLYRTFAAGTFPEQWMACQDGPNFPPQDLFLDAPNPGPGVAAYFDDQGTAPIEPGWYFDQATGLAWEFAAQFVGSARC